ncbi:hypothetical protein Acsp05_10440 [Actinokineospora sp. NBRC 105648]|nr:hypothetical protein Acsp05_10440 [Actinokineospora sp. NBRC 105648]
MFVLVALLVPMAVAESGEVSPWLAKRVLVWAARRLRSAEKTERYTEEWLADLEQVPGKITKLGWALGVAFLGVVRLREPKSALDWTPRPVVNPFATDSLFGPGAPESGGRLVPAPRAQTRPALPRPTAISPGCLGDGGYVGEPAQFEPGGVSYSRRFRQDPPVVPVPREPGARFFQRYYDNWGDSVHRRRYSYEEDAFTTSDQKAAPPVIGL